VLFIYLESDNKLNFPVSSNNNYYYAGNPYAVKVVIKNYPNLASNYSSFMGKVGAVLNKKYELYASYNSPAVVTDH
jgi:hypothetical protein